MTYFFILVVNRCLQSALGGDTICLHSILGGDIISRVAMGTSQKNVNSLP